MFEISKEVLGLVLDDEVSVIDDIETKWGMEVLPIWTKLNKRRYLNIHELAYKYKEWAWSQGYLVDSGLSLSSYGFVELYLMEQVEELGDDAPKIDIGHMGAISEIEPLNAIWICQEYIYKQVEGK